jgi:hypothetical protein
MPFLSVNGWTVTAENESPNESHIYHGEIGRSWSNRPNRARRSIPREWSLKSLCRTIGDADTLEALIEGRGHHFSFDFDAFSDSGLGPTAGSTYTIEEDSPVHGLGRLDIISPFTVTWDAELISGRYTIMYWRTILATPVHVTVRSDGAKWEDGVRDDSLSTTELLVTGGAVQLAVGDYDDLVILPVAASEDFIEQTYTFMAAQAYSRLPRLIVDGDITSNVQLECLGKIETEPHIQFGGAAWVNNARHVAFKISEERAKDRQKNIPEPVHGWRLSSDYVDGSGDLRPYRGALISTFPGAVTTVAGPFGFGEAFNFTGASNINISLKDEISESIIGVNAVTVVAWVRRDATAVTHTVFELSRTASTEKIILDITGSNSLRLGGIPDAGDSLETHADGTIADTDWHLVGGAINLLVPRITLFIDGVFISEETTLGGWSATEFDDVFGLSNSKIGNDANNVNRFDGDIAFAQLYHRELADGEHKTIYDLGRRGIFE